MYGSTHFQVYEHNLKRILLLDWLRNEQIRRRLAAPPGVGRTSARRTMDVPYWLVQAESAAASAG